MRAFLVRYGGDPSGDRVHIAENFSIRNAKNVKSPGAKRIVACMVIDLFALVVFAVNLNNEHLLNEDIVGDIATYDNLGLIIIVGE